MMSIKNFMITLALIGGLQAVDARSFDSCLNALKASARFGVSPCSLMTTYSRCILKESGLYKLTAESNEHLTELREMATEMMKKGGINCDIDFVKLAEKLREEDQHKLISYSKSSLVRQPASTAQQCLAAYSVDIFTGKDKCSATKEFAKCVIRVQSSNKMNLPNLNQLGQQFQQNGAGCNIDVPAMVQELRQAQVPGTGSSLLSSQFHLFAVLAFTVLSMFLFY